MRVVLDDLAIGADSPWRDGLGGVMRGRSVVRASGRRRVRKSVEAWRYVLEMCEDCFEDDDNDEMEVERMLCDMGLLVAVAVGLSASKAPLVVMVNDVGKIDQEEGSQDDRRDRESSLSRW